MFKFKTKKHLPSVLGVDFGSSGIRAVRVRISANKMQISHAWSSPDPDMAAFSLHSGLAARAVALATSQSGETAKLLTIPRPKDKLKDVPFAELLGISNPNSFRIALEIQESTAAETHALVAAIPEATAMAALRPFPRGFPSPQSLEVSGLAAINGIVLAQGLSEIESAILLDLGAETATVAITLQDRLAFMRQFRIGANTIMRKLGESLGMDAETAREVVGDGIIDAASQVNTVFDPLVRQIGLGRDFVSRRHNIRPSRLIATGGLFQTPFWLQVFQQALGVEAESWNPLKALPSPAGALSTELVAQGSRFAAAAGAAMAVMEQSRL